MKNEPNRVPYRAFACGENCHPIRYTAFSTRTWFGRKRWGVFDRHIGVRLARTYKSREALHPWLMSLQRMELRERGRKEAGS